MGSRILLVEDDQNLGEQIVSHLERDGFEVTWLRDGRSAMAADPRARDELQRAVDEVMVRFSNVERVKRIAVLGAEWLPDGDELTPTSKLKRRSILAKYSDAIEDIYH